MLLLEKIGRITPKQDKTNIPIEFSVEKGTEKFVIEYLYFPKKCSDGDAREMLVNSIEKYLGKDCGAVPEDFMPVNNLITLSLDGNGVYRGAAHRQANEQRHEIGEDYASPGFLKGKIDAGSWQVVLNVHCCACPVSYKIKITGEAAK